MPRWTQATVMRRVDLRPDTFLLDLEEPRMAAEIVPGQFVMLHRERGDFPFLPRPFSACDIVPEDASDPRGAPAGIRLLIRVVGPGTRSLAAMEAGERLAMWGPLGTHFRCEGTFDHAVIVAGGIGIAPFPLLIRRLRERSRSSPRITLLYGARRTGELVLLDRLAALGVTDLAPATDDGSRGRRGTALDLLRDRLAGLDPQRARIFACGPGPMLEAVARLAVAEGLPCQVSLERIMGCGVGACLGCVAATKDEGGGFRYTKTCTEGPVMDAGRLWLEEPDRGGGGEGV